jgi:hypothetical protein
MSLSQIAKATGMCLSTLRGRLLDAGVKLRCPADGMRLRLPDIARVQRGVRRGPMTEEARQRVREAAIRRGERDAVGTRITTSGYVEFTRGLNKGRLVHVVEMEERLGRRLLPDECAHHIDRNRSNNHPDNLALVTRSGHTRLHRYEDELSGATRERADDGRWS